MPLLQNLDTTDYSIIGGVIVVIITFFLTKDKFFGPKENVSAQIESRDLVEVVDKCNKKAVVIYCSQTGSAEDYATKFGREFQARFSLPTLVANTEDYDLDNINELPHNILVFLFVSSYGEGELPDSGMEFGEYLDSVSDGDLENLQYTIFGLGNSTYEFFNGAAKKVDQDLSRGGATRFAPYGEGDDGTDSLDEDFLAWKEKTYEIVRARFSLNEVDAKYEPGVVMGPAEHSESVYEGEHNAAYLTRDEEKIARGPYDHNMPFLAPIVLSKDLFSNAGDRHCIHAEFDISSSNLRYSTGDHLAILPSNSNEEVSNFLKAFGLLSEKNKAVSIKPLDATGVHSVPSPTTYEAMARHYLEITGPVSRQFLASIAEFAPSSDAKQLAMFLSKDKDAFHDKITAQKLNISDALLHLSKNEPWTDVPHSFIVDSIAHLQPRFYSISSSSISEKNTIHVTAVVEAEKGVGKPFVTGVATNLLHNIEVAQNNKQQTLFASYDLNGPRNSLVGFKLPVFVRRSSFKLPSSPALPVILIGPGTGVAPLRGFIRERIAQTKRGTKVGKTLLFFGCRNSKEDFLYAEEWEEAAKQLPGFEIVTAFSREGPQKVYVQHRMKERSKQIGDLLDEKAYLYVCGDASSMARSVQSALIEIVSEAKDVPEEKAGEILREYKSCNRYQEDVW